MNRTIMELRPSKKDAPFLMNIDMNRTIMELRPFIFSDFSVALAYMNRTIMELRFDFHFSVHSIIIYESYHHGIEMEKTSNTKKGVTKYESYHHGIETRETFQKHLFEHNMNRTIMELRPFSVKFF